MNINLSLFGQMITFVIFVWFTMKYVWPPITKALEERQQKIADGLAAGERGERELELAQHKVTAQMRDAKLEAAEIVDKANRRAVQIVEDAKQKAREEGNRLLALADQDIDQHVQSAKQQLRKQVASLAVTGAERIIGRNIDKASNAELVQDLINEL